MQFSRLTRNPNFKWALLVLVLFVLWMLSGLIGTDNNAEAVEQTTNTKATALPQVKSKTFTPESYTRTLSLPAQTAARYKATLRAQTAGRVSALNVENGAAVKKGQLLAVIDAAERRTELLSAKAQLASATKLASSARKLAADGFMSQTELAARVAQEAEAKARVQNIQQDLAYTRITAPIDGVVENRSVSVGDFASVGAALMDVVNRTELLLTANLPQKDRNRVQVGQLVSATLITGEEINGVVDFIATDANASSRTFRVDMAVDGSQFDVPTGMSADVHIPTGAVQAYRVPHSVTVLNDAGTIGVMQLVGDTARFMPITVIEDNQDALLLTGLEGAAEIITTGHLSIVDGAQVMADEGAE